MHVNVYSFFIPVDLMNIGLKVFAVDNTGTQMLILMHDCFKSN